MICKECKIDKDQSKFLKVEHLDNEICITCHHLKKKANVVPQAVVRTCNICKKELADNKRWKFCSPECSRANDKLNKKEHWRFKISVPSNPWRSYKK